MSQEKEGAILSSGEVGRKVASLLTSPETVAYRILMASERAENINMAPILDAIDVLREQSESVHRGDLKRAESMLMAQATALQSIFAKLVEKGMDGLNLQTFEINMRMALRAQNQCRATLETLAAIKNPPVVFAKQANVTTGPQQVNNGVAAHPCAEEIKSTQTQLLQEANNVERLDFGAPGKAIGGDQEMVPLGEINGTKNRSRKTQLSNAGLQGR